MIFGIGDSELAGGKPLEAIGFVVVDLGRNLMAVAIGQHQGVTGATRHLAGNGALRRRWCDLGLRPLEHHQEGMMK